MRWIRPQEELEDALQAVKKQTPQLCPAEDIIPEEGTCKEDAGEGRHETYVKLSVTHVIKKDISVATAPSIRGTNPLKEDNATGLHIQVKDAKQ